jgi:hypothetical protein
MAERTDRVADRRRTVAVELRLLWGALRRRRIVGHHGQVEVRVDVHALRRQRLPAVERHGDRGIGTARDVLVGEHPAAPGIDHEPGALERAHLVLREGPAD